jgi:hypothetical protein
MNELARQNNKNPSLDQRSDDIRRKYQSYAKKFL